jgi:hypothetical protein
MFAIVLLSVTVLALVSDASKPSIQLTFNPDEKYFARDAEVEITCELLNPNAAGESAQLWHVDMKSGRRTAISRSLLTSPRDDDPTIFRANLNQRYYFVKKNHIRIRRTQMDDSARYECNCPDCDTDVKATRNLLVMKFGEPHWSIEPGWPIHENTQTTLKCIVDDFYPYVGHKILRDHEDITHKGKANPLAIDTLPQKFVWEMSLVPKSDWHNNTLRCIVTEGLFRS